MTACWGRWGATVRMAARGCSLEPTVSLLSTGCASGHPRGRGELRWGARSGSCAEVTSILFAFALSASMRLTLGRSSAELKHKQPPGRQQGRVQPRLNASLILWVSVTKGTYSSGTTRCFQSWIAPRDSSLSGQWVLQKLKLLNSFASCAPACDPH